ncbi:MAG: polyribonucleotide nucleotidyltransferase [Planctomycetota bacterium]
MSKETVNVAVGGRELSFETGYIAKQAAGAVIVRMGDTVILAAATHAPLRAGSDYFPLMIDYRERGYASGKIFGGRFMKREGRPSDRETLISRMADRPLRPLWPDGFMRDVVVQALSLSAEPDVDPDTLVINGVSMALCLSDLPFEGPIGAVRVGLIKGDLIVNPTKTQLEESELDLLVAGTDAAITMVECGANELSEEKLVEALMFGHDWIRKICAAQKVLAAKAGKPKMEYKPEAKHPVYETIKSAHAAEIEAAVHVPEKMERYAAIDALKKRLVEQYAATEADGAETKKPTAAQVSDAFGAVKAMMIRKAIKDDKRVDGRSRTAVRPIESVIGWLPRVHGSAIFTRGETQSVVTVTLGTSRDEQLYETLNGEYSSKFLLHYNFPSFCVGETKPPRGPGRREIGHGMLAHRALSYVLPKPEDFNYTIRVVSEVTESNGSSSQATICGGTLALMDAGVPIKSPVAGIAMGLVADADGEFIITDILGDEDHYGDMDFKVAGTRNGVTALQMDIKMSGLNAETLHRALDQAKTGRMHILDEMAKTISKPTENVSQYAPKIISIKIPKDMIGKIIGPGGSVIRKLEEDYSVKIDIEEEADIGIVIVSAVLRDDAEAAAAVVKGMTQTPEIGAEYDGVVKTVREFGAFIEIMPGVDALCHVSELSYDYIQNIDDVIKVGDSLRVKLIDIDSQGRLRLSHRALLEKPEGWEEPERRPQSGRDGGGRGGRDGGRGGSRRR